MAELKINNPRVKGKLKLPEEIAGKALQVSASGELESSSVTTAELANIAGLTSAAVSVDGTQTLTNKTLTAPAISSPTGIVKGDVGLGNVDNTSDADKPVSTAQASADSAVQAYAIQRDNHTGTQLASTISDFDAAAKSAAVSDSITNGVLDVAPSQNAVFDALALKIASSEKGAANGVATLDANSLIPITQLPPAALERLVIVADEAARFALTTATVQNGDTVKQTDTSLMYFVKDDANLDSAAGYEAYTAGAASSVAWSGITGTPTTLAGYGITDYEEAAQDAVGSILSDSASIDFTYTDGGPSISASVLPAGVDHDALANFVADEHIAHSSVVFSGAANGGISSSIGDITASRSISIDITNATAETSAQDSDMMLIHDDSASALRKMSRADFLSGRALSSIGDIAQSSFSAANNQVAAANVTGFAFANASVRSFEAQVSVMIDATADLYEMFRLEGIQKGASWDMAVSSVGDESGISFSITSAGQIQYTSASLSGFVSSTMKFRATVTNV